MATTTAVAGVSQKRLVPWISWEEWEQVGSWLFSENPVEEAQGLARVAAWRCRGKLPLGADITACLVEIRLRDPSLTAPQPSTTPNPELQLRLLYSMTLVRFVNGIADSAQKGPTAASVAKLADAAGLPQVLVHVRHEATHNELPSLALLRLAAEQGLAWLRACYWQRQQDHLAACHARIATLLQETFATRRSMLLLAQPKADTEEAAGVESKAAPEGTGNEMQELRKQHERVMAELRGRLPESSTCVLVPPLLDSGLCNPPMLAVPAPGRDGGTSASVSSSSSERVAQEAWRVALQGLCRKWPALPALLAAGAVQRLAALATRPTANPARSSAWLAWLGWLAGLAAKPSVNAVKAIAGAGGATDGGSLWQPSVPQCCALIASCLAAASAIALSEHASSCEYSVADGTVGGALHQTLVLQVKDALQNAARLLLPIMELQKDGTTEHVKELLRLTSISSCANKETIAETPSACNTGLSDAPAEALQDAAAEHASLVGRLKQKQEALNGQRPQQIWRRATSWTPCAMGALPSPHDPNGLAVEPAAQSSSASSPAACALFHSPTPEALPTSCLQTEVVSQAELDQGLAEEWELPDYFATFRDLAEEIGEQQSVDTSQADWSRFRTVTVSLL